MCPECHGGARKVFHPAPIIFKGGGFYVTDSRKNTGLETSKEHPTVKEESTSKEKEKGK
jgi:predicted nucleic acid-binding Zn ribbon protein